MNGYVSPIRHSPARSYSPARTNNANAQSAMKEAAIQQRDCLGTLLDAEKRLLDTALEERRDRLNELDDIEELHARSNKESAEARLKHLQNKYRESILNAQRAKDRNEQLLSQLQSSAESASASQQAARNLQRQELTQRLIQLKEQYWRYVEASFPPWQRQAEQRRLERVTHLESCIKRTEEIEKTIQQNMAYQEVIEEKSEALAAAKQRIASHTESRVIENTLIRHYVEPPVKVETFAKKAQQIPDEYKLQHDSATQHKLALIQTATAQVEAKQEITPLQPDSSSIPAPVVEKQNSKPPTRNSSTVSFQLPASVVAEKTEESRTVVTDTINTVQQDLAQIKEDLKDVEENATFVEHGPSTSPRSALRDSYRQKRPMSFDGVSPRPSHSILKRLPHSFSGPESSDETKRIPSRAPSKLSTGYLDASMTEGSQNLDQTKIDSHYSLQMQGAAKRASRIALHVSTQTLNQDPVVVEPSQLNFVTVQQPLVLLSQLWSAVESKVAQNEDAYLNTTPMTERQQLLIDMQQNKEWRHSSMTLLSDTILLLLQSHLPEQIFNRTHLEMLHNTSDTLLKVYDPLPHLSMLGGMLWQDLLDHLDYVMGDEDRVLKRRLCQVFPSVLISAWENENERKRWEKSMAKLLFFKLPPSAEDESIMAAWKETNTTSLSKQIETRSTAEKLKALLQADEL